ncbi:MAG TPA: HmuY family protein [Chitinophagales bacterium]|jgi:hypothetical protein|nr:HmuY family protein [Chitinophagales bacterium]HQW78446.1 HmuY family protein [Chitinophagales bacterium]HRB67462.1 HmuY family protein [Chitinophagales bacterium]
MKKLFLIAFSLGIFGLISCTQETTPKPTPPLKAVIDSNINATYSHYQFYSFEKGDTVPFSDSTTLNWDMAFNGTKIIFNSGTSGSGTAGVIIKNALFSEVLEAPTTGYVQDGATYAIPSGSNNGWYNYAGPPNHTITPLAGKVFVVKTSKGKYAKFEILSYYLGNPAIPNGLLDISKYYTIRFVYQPDGSTNLK